MLLTIDAGNTRTKWAIFNHQGEITHMQACLNDQVSGSYFNALSENLECVIISNVAGKTHAAKLEHLLAKPGLPITWAKASHQCCNVTNRYLEAETLGTDRWAALIAAWHIQQAPCIVVNAGTAITIDALTIQHENNQQGEFAGGMILPGVSMMLSSLGQNTAQLPKHAPANELLASTGLTVLARSTAEAIRSGVLHAIVGAIVQMSKTLETKYGQNPYIILSGGDASVIQSCMNDTVANPSLIIEHLVLKGLYLIGRSRQ